MKENQLSTYWNDIPCAKKDAVTYPVLKMWWNLNEREVRRALHELSSFDNGDDYILIRSGKSKGFYKTDDRREIELYKRECLNKGRSVFAPVKKINRVLRANATQYSLMNNLRVVREGLDFKQKTVCDYMQEFDSHFDIPLLSKYENGVCLPTPLQLAKLAELYGCEPEDLIKTELY